MKIAVIDDYQDAFRNVKAFAKLAGHDVITYTDSEKDPAKLAKRLEGCEVVVLTQQRSFMPRAVIEKLPASVKLLAQTGRNVPHIDAAARINLQREVDGMVRLVDLRLRVDLRERVAVFAQLIDDRLRGFLGNAGLELAAIRHSFRF